MVYNTSSRPQSGTVTIETHGEQSLTIEETRQLIGQLDRHLVNASPLAILLRDDAGMVVGQQCPSCGSGDLAEYAPALHWNAITWEAGWPTIWVDNDDDDSAEGWVCRSCGVRLAVPLDFNGADATYA